MGAGERVHVRLQLQTSAELRLPPLGRDSEGEGWLTQGSSGAASSERDCWSGDDGCSDGGRFAELNDARGGGTGSGAGSSPKRGSV